MSSKNTPHHTLPLIAQLLSARRREAPRLWSSGRNGPCLLCEHITQRAEVSLCERCERALALGAGS